MNRSKLNLIFYKGTCIAGGAILFLIGLKIIFDRQFVKGYLSLVCSGILLLLLLSKPTLRAWIQLIIVLLIAINIISELAKI